MSKTAMSDDSMPTARTNPLAWQKAESEGMPPPTKLTIANMTKTKAFAKSLWIRSKINLLMVSEGRSASPRMDWYLLVPETPSHLHEPVQGG